MLGHERCRPWVRVAGQDRAWWLVPVAWMGQLRAWARPVRVLSRRSGAGACRAARPGIGWPAGDGGLAAVTGDLAARGPGGPPAVEAAFVPDLVVGGPAGRADHGPR